MKSTLKELFYSALITFVCCLILVGLLFDYTLIKITVTTLLSLVTASMFIATFGYLIHAIELYAKHKKKMKTNEIKIKLKVIYKLRDYPTVSYFKIFVSHRDLADCVRDAIDYAKENNYIVCSMDLLTTED